MAEELEELSLKIDELILGVNHNELREISKLVGIDPQEISSRSRAGLVKLCRLYYESEEDDKEEQSKRLQLLQSAVFKVTGQEASPPVPPRVSSTTRATPTTPVTKISVADQSVLITRELKLFGQIGEPGQKDKLTYVSIQNQIKDAELRGFTEREIICVVIRSMTPSLTLRRYLEATAASSLTLQLVKKFLRSHFQEKSAQELYTELDSLTQNPEEEPMSFLFRAFELEAKIILAAEAEDPNSHAAKYLGMVRGLTLHSIETGLSHKHESIRAHEPSYEYQVLQQKK